MRGLIYKDLSIFIKCLDKRTVVLGICATVLLFVQDKSYGSLLATIMLALVIGIQHTMAFANEEKASWKKYQLAMPVSNFSVVASKYISVICTSGISLLGSFVLNLISSIRNGYFDPNLWPASITAAIFIPIIWTGITMPLTYWFGFRSAQTMGVVLVLPMTYLMSYFEDTAGLPALADSTVSYVFTIGVLALLLFGASLCISTIGYARKK